MENIKTPIGEAILAIKAHQKNITSSSQQLGLAQAMDILEVFIPLERLEFKKVYLEAFEKGFLTEYWNKKEINQAEKAYYEKVSCLKLPEEEEKPKLLIQDIEMPVRLKNSFETHGFKYLEDVVKLTEKELFQYRCIGRKQIYDLKIILEKYNLEFKKQ